jgi:hypothetical protein
MFGIGSDSQESLGRGSKQQIVNYRLILQGQGSQDVRQSEDDMIVGHGQQFGRALLQPALASCRLAFWAMPIEARVIRDGSLSTTVTLLDVSAKRSGTTSGNRTQDFEMRTG